MIKTITNRSTFVLINRHDMNPLACRPVERLNITRADQINAHSRSPFQLPVIPIAPTLRVLLRPLLQRDADHLLDIGIRRGVAVARDTQLGPYLINTMPVS